MSEELNKEMEYVDEDKIGKPKIDDHGAAIVEPTQKPKGKASGSVKDAKDPKTTKSDAVKSEGTKSKVKTEDDADDDEELRQRMAATKDSDSSTSSVGGAGKDHKTHASNESVSTPKLKSEIFAKLVDHMKGLKKEDLAKMYGTMMTEVDKGVQGDEGDKDDTADDDIDDETKVKKESIDQVIDNLDVSQDVEALIQGEELSEEFKTKAATIFETAIKSKVRSELEKIQEENEQLMTTIAEESLTSMVEKVDDYLNYVVEQWMSDNELAIERGLKGEVAEDFISGLKGLFEDHYIDVPDEKYDILEANLTKIEELEDKLNKQMEENVQLKKAKGELVKESMIADVADGMTDTETEKFQSLVDDVEFSDEESYKEKLQTIKESYFGTGKVESEETETLTEEGSEQTEEVSDTMATYMSAIKKDNNRSKK